MKTRANPMHLVNLMNAAPRCSVMSKRSRCRCRAPAVTGRLMCRMHGARAGAPTGKANGAWQHGHASNDALAMRRELAELMRQSRAVLEQLLAVYKRVACVGM